MDLLHQCEWGGTCDKHAIANSGYRLNGQTLAAAGRGPVTTTNGYIYSNDTFTPMGLKLNGSQIILQQPGCRPRSVNQCGPTLWGATDAQVTRYINRFSDGEVWVSADMNIRSGTQISWPTAGGLYPRGIRYLIVQLCAGGGAGGSGGLGVTYSNHGGQGGAGVVCIRLPESGYATIIAGGGGSGVSGFAADGNDGKASRVQSGVHYAQANGGGGGDGSTSKTKGAGGTWQYNDTGADSVSARVIAGSYGAEGTTGGKTISYTDYCPEGGTYTTEAAGAGGNRGGTGYGAGANGGNGFVKLFY